MDEGSMLPKAILRPQPDQVRGCQETQFEKGGLIMVRSLFVGATLLLLASLAPAFGVTQMNYGSLALTGGGDPKGHEVVSGDFPELWDLTKCGLEIRFTVDLSGVSDILNASGYIAHAWSELGVRSPGFPNFNPTWDTEGAGAWVKADYSYAAGGLAPNPDKWNNHDRIFLQAAGAYHEDRYSLPSPPANQWNNYGFNFDRDGADAVTASNWGHGDGVTYNTNARYDIVIQLQADTAYTGTAFMTVNGVSQGFYTGSARDATPEIYPAGITFTGNMTQMQVFYGVDFRFGEHTVKFENIQVTGCLFFDSQIDVQIDIKPGSYPNAINLGSSGVIPVAIFSTSSFDATSIKPDTVALSGANVAIRGKGQNYLSRAEDVNGDGLLDLVVQVDVENLSTDLIQDGFGVLTGETLDGYFILGYDEIMIVRE